MIEVEETDIVRIKSSLVKDIISKLISKVLKKKVGHNIDIKINEADAVTKHGKVRLHLDVNIEMDIADFKKILLSKDL